MTNLRAASKLSSKFLSASTTVISILSRGQKAIDLEFRYKTSLPPPIGHPKLLQVPLPPDYLTRYMGAELETQRHWHLKPESGLIIPIDLWDPSAYKPNTEGKINPQIGLCV